MKKFILRTAILTAVTAACMLQSCTESAESTDTNTDGDATVHSAEDAATAAEASITDANADEELEKLTNEIESELED